MENNKEIFNDYYENLKEDIDSYLENDTERLGPLTYEKIKVFVEEAVEEEDTSLIDDLTMALSTQFQRTPRKP